MRILTRLNGMPTILNNVAWFSVSDENRLVIIVDNNDDLYYITLTDEAISLSLNDWMYDALRDGYIDFSHEKYFSELIKDTDLEDDDSPNNSQLYFEQLKAEQEADDE